MATDTESIAAAQRLVDGEYGYGFVTEVEEDRAPKGLDENVVRFISARKEEPQWLLDWRLRAFRAWEERYFPAGDPTWAKVHYPPINYQDAYYYAAPKSQSDRPKSLDEVDPELVKKYLGTVVPYADNSFATLNSAVFSDGTFVYVPPGVRCPMELSTYFRINAENTGQFERTLLIADKGSYVSYLEGCTAPMRDENQLHAAVVEIVALDDAEVKYSTVQNWYPGNKDGEGGIYNFVTKRGACRGRNSKISWTQVETGSAITWKYPSCILQGDNSVGEFYSVAVTNNYQQADTGTKMIHIGANTRSTIISKSISAGHAQNTYRGLVRIQPKAHAARNYTQCDGLLLGDRCGAHTVPYIEVKNNGARVEHEASTSKISDDQLFYCMQRGLSAEDGVNLIVNGFCKVVFQELPMEFAVEAQKLLEVSLEGSIG